MAVDNARFGGMFAVKSADAHLEHAERDGKLRRAIGLFDLTALGLGAIIGTGIFVILGEAIGDSRPAIVLSFRHAGVTCAFSALSYSELASSIPVSGSAYTYAYATMGELLAWIIGWDLILEYGVSVAAVAVGWAVPQLPAGRCSGGGCRTRSASRRETAGSSTFRPRSWCSRSPGC